MQGLGGFVELWLLFMAGAAILYYVLEPLVCWIVVGVGLLLKRLFRL